MCIGRLTLIIIHNFSHLHRKTNVAVIAAELCFISLHCNQPALCPVSIPCFQTAAVLGELLGLPEVYCTALAPTYSLVALLPLTFRADIMM